MLLSIPSQNFFGDPHTVVVPPYEAADVPILYQPSALNTVQVQRIFKHAHQSTHTTFKDASSAAKGQQQQHRNMDCPPS